MIATLRMPEEALEGPTVPGIAMQTGVKYDIRAGTVLGRS